MNLYSLCLGEAGIFVFYGTKTRKEFVIFTIFKGGFAMSSIRTDLASEAKALWEESAQSTSTLEGIVAHEEDQEGYHISHIQILNDKGAHALGKPLGNYISLDLPTASPQQDHKTPANLLAQQIDSLLPKDKKAPVLVVGLGNRRMTSDALGSCALQHLLVTRHLVSGLPAHFGTFRPVSALATGVLGDTGLESGEIIQALVAEFQPACVIAIDALASRSVDRLFQSVQVSDTGIVPGSGVGNHRVPLNRDTLGIPVLALGVPTVVDAATLTGDILQKAGKDCTLPSPILAEASRLFVTPRDVDALLQYSAKLLGLGLSLALHADVPPADIQAFLS